MNADLSRHNPRVFFWVLLFGSVNFMLPVTTLFFYHRGMDAQGIFHMLIAWVVAAFLAEIPTGTLGDWIGYRAAFLAGFSLNTLAIVIWYFAHEPMMFYLSAVISAVGISFFSGSEEAFIYESLKLEGREGEMSQVWAKISAANWLPTLFVVPFAAWLARDLSESSFRILIGLTLGFLLLQGIMIMLLKPLPQALNAPSSGHLLRTSFSDIKKNRDLLLITSHECMVMIPTFVLTAGYSLAQPYMVDAGVSVPALGWIYAFDAALCFVLLRQLGAIEGRVGRKGAIYISGIMIAIAFIVGISFPGNPWIAIGVYLSIKLCWVFRFPLFSQLKNDHIRSENRATVLSILSMLDSAFDLIILGTLSYISSWPITQMFIVCVTIVLLGMLIPLRSAPDRPKVITVNPQ
jgi:MFS family permease